MNSIKLSLPLVPLLLAILVSFLTACHHEEDAHLPELLEHLEDTSSKLSDSPVAQNDYEGKVRREMKERLHNELAAIGTDKERRTIIEYLQREKVVIPAYLYQQAVVNHYLFENYYADSAALFDKIPTPEEIKKDSSDEKSKKKEPKKAITKEQLTERAKERRAMESLSAGFLADIFYVEAPIAFPATQLEALATKLRHSISQPVTEESLSTLLESFREEQKIEREGGEAHLSKGKKARKNNQKEQGDLTTVKASLIRGIAFNHQDAAFSAGKTWHIAPSTTEPKGILVDNAGNLMSASERTIDHVVSPVYEDLENVEGGHRRYAFYLKIADIKQTDMSFNEVEDIIVLSSLYALMTEQFLIDQFNMLREGDWSFYPKNLTDKQ